jgi:hypothetical protein
MDDTKIASRLRPHRRQLISGAIANHSRAAMGFNKRELAFEAKARER